MLLNQYMLFTDFSASGRTRDDSDVTQESKVPKYFMHELRRLPKGHCSVPLFIFRPKSLTRTRLSAGRKREGRHLLPEIYEPWVTGL